MIDAPVRHDDEIGRKVCSIRFDEDVGLDVAGNPRLRVANNPPCRVSSRDGQQGLAGLESDVGDALRGGLDRIDGAAFVGELMLGADERCIAGRNWSPLSTKKYIAPSPPAMFPWPR